MAGGSILTNQRKEKPMNEILLPAKELNLALAGLSRVVSRKSSLPVLQSLKLSRSADGRVTLSATDLDTFVSYNIEQPQSGQPVDLLLPFEQLNKSVKGANGEVIVTQEAKNRAKLRYQIGGSPLEQSVATLSAEEFPPTPKITEPACKMPENFGECLRQAFQTSSTDSSRYVLQGAYLDIKEPKCHTIVSANGRALFAANTFKFDLKAPVNISRQKFLEWSGFLAGECEMAVKTDKSNSGWVKLTTPRWDCLVKQIDGQFPNWRQVVPADTETWTKVRLSEGAITQMLALTSKLPGDDDINRQLRLRVDQELHLEGRNKDDKDYTSAVITDVKITGKSVTTALNREYLETALRCGLDEIRIHNELEPILFLKPGKRMIVMPVHLVGPPAQITAKPTPATQTQPTNPPASTPAEERKTEMAKTTNPSPKPEPTQPAATSPSLIDQVEMIKESLKNIIRDLTAVIEAVKQAEKDKRASEKEVESVRSTLKKLQQVTI
jgi:DNA polymerase-3 subunit beta